MFSIPKSKMIEIPPIFIIFPLAGESARSAASLAGGAETDSRTGVKADRVKIFHITRKPRPMLACAWLSGDRVGTGREFHSLTVTFTVAGPLLPWMLQLD